MTAIEDHPEALDEFKKRLAELENIEGEKGLTTEEKSEKKDLPKLIARMESTKESEKVYAKKSTGEQWRFVFNGTDGSYYRLTDKRDEDFEQID